jgi:sugar phosphate permease
MESRKSSQATLWAICVGYAIYSAVRRTLAISLPLMLHDLQLTKSDLGIITSNFSLAYGASKFIWSLACDQISCKLLFLFGLIMTSVLCVAFTLGSSVEYLSAIWFLNGCMQGVGWPALASIIFENFESSQRGTAWSAATAVCAPSLLCRDLTPPLVPTGREHWLHSRPLPLHCSPLFWLEGFESFFLSS